MKINEAIKAITALRDDCQAENAALKEASPHLLNAAAALSTAARNLEGHLAATAEPAKTAAPAAKK